MWRVSDSPWCRICSPRIRAAYGAVPCEAVPGQAIGTTVDFCLATAGPQKRGVTGGTIELASSGLLEASLPFRGLMGVQSIWPFQVS